MRFPGLALGLLALTARLPAADYAAANPIWNRPIEPFTIAGNLHYVGAADVSAFLITTSEGHILLDCGFRETVPQIEASMKKLGYALADIRLLLISHGHCDHMGGMAGLKARTGARLLAPRVEFAALQAGGAGDFAFGDGYCFPPVTPDAALADGEAVSLGGTTLTAHWTPGHTRGSTSWSLLVRDGVVDRRVVIAASLSAPGYRLVANPAYPDIVADFERSFAKLRALPCDILLAGHSWDFGLHEKRAALGSATAGTNPFVETDALPRLVDRAETKLRSQVAEQQAKADSHSFGGDYLELVPHERLRYTDRFDDPNLPGVMTVTVALRAVACGTEVNIEQAGIPAVIPAEMCYLGWQDSLEQLAALVEPDIRQ